MRHLTFEFPWLQFPHLREVIQLMEKAGGQARFVGGAVRDSLLDKTPTDFDIAVSLPPERVMTVLEQADIKVIPTGLKHGTVTAVLNHHPLEITTLRKDIQTDGRHATVQYTDSFQQDAARRDFTMNALFLDIQGNLYDFFDGIKDLRQGIIRFIGAPLKRVQEDYLRILRFFRFQAYYALEPRVFHPQSLDACLSSKHLLTLLSKERITQEWLKLLAAPSPFELLEHLMAHGIVGIVQGPLKENLTSVLERLRCLARLEEHLDTQADHLVRLFLLSDSGKNLDLLCLSKHQAQTLNKWRTTPAPFTKEGVQEVYYRLSCPTMVIGWLWLKSVLLLETNDQPFETIQKNLQTFFASLDACEKPKFPLSGKDLMPLGVPQGVQMKTWLNALEAWWIEEKFVPDKRACLEEFKKRNAHHSTAFE